MANAWYLRQHLSVLLCAVWGGGDDIKHTLELASHWKDKKKTLTGLTSVPFS